MRLYHKLLIMLYLLAWLAFFLVLVYQALSAAFFPFGYRRGSEHLVIQSVVEAPGLSLGDHLLAVNGQPVDPNCVYLFSSPIAGLHPGDPIRLTIQRDDMTAMVEVASMEPLPLTVSYLIITVITAFLSFLAGIVIILGGREQSTRLLVGTLGLVGGMIIIGIGALSGYRTAFGFTYALGIPLWAGLTAYVHRLWPERIPNTPILTAILITTLAAAALAALLTVLTSYDVGCPLPGARTMAEFASVAAAGLGVVASVAPLSHTAGNSTNHFRRAQCRFLLWCIIIGVGFPILLSMIPELLGDTVFVAPGLVVAVTIVLPGAYAYVAYQTLLDRLERITTGLLVLVLWVTVWAFGGTFLIWLLEQIVGPMDALGVAIVMMIPALLFALYVRDPLRDLTNLVLYGRVYYDDRVLAVVTDQLRGFPSPPALAETLTRSLHDGLALRQTALWIADGGGQLKLRRVQSDDEEAMHLPDALQLTALDAAAPSGKPGVAYFQDPLPLGGVTWRAAVTFTNPDGDMLGVLLLGPKRLDRPFSGHDTALLEKVKAWVDNVLHTRALHTQTLAEDRLRTEMLLEHEEELRRRIGANLHDAGLTELASLKARLERGEAPQSLLPDVQRVIDNLRQLSREEVSPFETTIGLIEAVTSLAYEHSLTGASVELHYANAEVAEWRAFDHDSKVELYFVIREALRNAVAAREDVEVDITFTLQPDSYEIAIDDNGPGFEVERYLNSPNRHNRGISIMRARIDRIDGELSIVSDLGKGTTVLLSGPRPERGIGA